MERLAKILLFAAAIPGAVFAQAASSQPPLPPAMQSAINRIVAGTPNPPAIQLHNPPAAGACSIPLLEMRVDHPERFPIQTAPAPKTGDVMPSSQGPSPPCNEPQAATRP
jgi:hypothetical protein